MGWSTYFAFIFAAINTLTVTYYLAIEKIPSLTLIFPNFLQYVLIVTIIGIPVLVVIGYVHYKRTVAFKSEVDVVLESQPYQRRNIVNIALILESILETNRILLKTSKGDKLKDEDLEKISTKLDEISSFVKNRTFFSSLDMDYVQKNVRDK
tara:strand:- start:10350 stop:10805 length:456 start_codon:yes stop_codon:yes gene_type:complete